MLQKICLICLVAFPIYGKVELGVDRLFQDKTLMEGIKGKRIGLITNHTGQNSKLESTLDLFEKHAGPYTLKAIYAPEHGLTGVYRAGQKIKQETLANGIPVYPLYGENRRPTKEMLEEIDLLVFDIQDSGSRTYAYATTLFYAMEEGAKANIPVLVLDRPNPINGETIDGPILQEDLRSFVGYLQVPLCHGMTIGELALYFNEEYQVACSLKVIPMKGWRRSMALADCHLPWVPLSPHIPDQETPTYFPITGLIGEALSNVSIGVGYTLPFKVVGAPWIDGKHFAKTLNSQKFAGIHFQPFEFSPFFGRFKGEVCRGVRLVVTDPLAYKPVSIDFLILGTIKSLYPAKFQEGLKRNNLGKHMLNRISGTEEVYQILSEEKYISWKLIGLHQKERETFKIKRKKYLLYT